MGLNGMKSNIDRLIRLTFPRVIQRMVVDASLGAVCGALYGLAFGCFGIAVHGEVWETLSIAGHWALCIAAIATLVGSFSRVLEAVDSSDLPASADDSVGVHHARQEGSHCRDVLPHLRTPIKSIASVGQVS
jgi:hypothetical protein